MYHNYADLFSKLSESTCIKKVFNIHRNYKGKCVKYFVWQGMHQCSSQLSETGKRFCSDFLVSGRSFKLGYTFVSVFYTITRI